MGKLKVLTIFGTRPEAIKMAPLVKEIEKNSELLESKVCVTAQHREMLDSVLELFEIRPDYDLDIMKTNQNLWTLTSDVLLKTKDVIEKEKPDIVLVHGDTTTSSAAALSAFYAKIPVGHVEAGLRTFDKYYPFPEEINRVITDAVSSYYFAPTEKSCENLRKSSADEKQIYKTGNTVIDALFYTIKKYPGAADDIKINPENKLILLTSHRRENFGESIKNICRAAIEIAEKYKNVEIVYPVHPNPNVSEPVHEILGGKERIHLIKPLEYAKFCALMKKAHIILTDSGGVQEEAPSLGKPVLVLRDTTERPEAVEYGTVKLVGTDKNKIVSEVTELLTNKESYKKMSESINPYGDGKASVRIVEVLKKIRSDKP